MDCSCPAIGLVVRITPASSQNSPQFDHARPVPIDDWTSQQCSPPAETVVRGGRRDSSDRASVLADARPLYGHLVTLFESAIARGELPSGSRLPPERELAQRLRISRTTVVSAYRELESRGLLRGYVGRGTFVCAAPEPAGTPFAWRGKIAVGGAPLQRLDAARRAPALVGRAAAVARGRRAGASTAFRPRRFSGRSTTCSSTTPAPRGATARPRDNRRCAMRSRERFGVPPESVLVLAGAQQGLDLLARCLIDPGDAVIIDRPGYLGAIQSFRAAGAKLIGWDVARADIDELEDLLVRYRPKLIYTNPTFQNPTGTTLPIRTRSRAAQARRAVSRPDRRGRHLSRAVLPRGAAAVAARPRRAEPRDPPEQLLEGHGAGAAARLAVGGAVDRRSDRDHQAAARSAHAEPRAVRDGAADSRGQLRRAPEDAARRARAAVHADGDGARSATCRPARCGSRGRREGCTCGAAWHRA